MNVYSSHIVTQGQLSCQYRNLSLITGINIASVARAVLLAVAAQRTPTSKCAAILEERFRVAQGRRDDIPIEINQVCVVRKPVARGRLSRGHAVRVMAGVAWDIAIFQVPGMLAKALIIQDAVIVMAAETQGISGTTLRSIVCCHVTTNKQCRKSGTVGSVRTTATASARCIAVVTVDTGNDAARWNGQAGHIGINARPQYRME